MKVFADLVFLNGKVITADAENNLAEAVAVKGNTIAYCGSNKGALEFVGKTTRQIDLKGHTLMPGFIDSHIHFGLLGLKQGPIIDITFEKRNCKNCNSFEAYSLLAFCQAGNCLC